MRFQITRTSEWNDEVCPIEGAKRELITRMDARSVGTIEEARKCHWFQKWWDGGINHREENGCVVCDRREKQVVWTIEVNTLEELMSIFERAGSLIIRPSINVKEYPIEIEIYDDYRE